MSLLNLDKYTTQKGCYVGAYLPEIFTKKVIDLAEALGLPTPEPDDLHCTVIYSRETAIQFDRMPKLLTAINALVTSVQHWVGHNGKTYVVADVQSMALCQLHTKMHNAGARHSFAAYRPHITLGKLEGKPSEEFEKLVEEINWSLKQEPIHVAFVGCNVSDINSDD